MRMMPLSHRLEALADSIRKKNGDCDEFLSFIEWKLRELSHDYTKFMER